MTDNILFQNTLSALGFIDATGLNPHYYPLEEFKKLHTSSHLSRVAKRISSSVSETSETVLSGAYFLENDDSNVENCLKPIVFLAQAQDDAGARQVHKSLWNLGSIAFLVIVLPWEIRVYTGFDYDRENVQRGLIESIPIDQQSALFTDIAVVGEALKKYSAEAVDNGSIWEVLRNTDRFSYENRVDKRLLRSLKDLETELLKRLNNFEPSVALQYIHAIIGKFVYFRYLFDRGILTNEWASTRDIDLVDVFGRESTTNELLKLDRAIQERFGGNVFPFPDDFGFVVDDSVVSFVASVFNGEEPVGRQQSLFDVYNFSYIPVEMLSYIYEQFLAAQGKTKKEGAVYTPEALADYLINEIHTIKPLHRTMKILDPCCGSGIFLVLTYRYLIELELRNNGRDNLLPTELRTILQRCIYGVELNLEACYVTEFSLLLVLLNYVEPPDLNKNPRFRFPRLLGTNIFQGNFFDPRREFYPLSLMFDWIIGNPPWKAVRSTTNPDEMMVSDWIKSNSERYPVGGKRMEEAFAWRALEFIAPDGCVGFILTAKRLFNSTSKRFRKAFFCQTHTRRITNFSNFHYLFFPADVSPMTIVYQPASKEKLPIWHFGPFAANQVAANLKNKPVRPIWLILINRNEVKSIPQEIAEKGEMLTWKVALWGSYQDQKIISRIKNSFSGTIGQMCDDRDWSLVYGLQLRSNDSDDADSSVSSVEAIRPIGTSLFSEEGQDIRELDPNRVNSLGARYHIPEAALFPVPPNRRFFRARGGSAGEKLIAAPHIVVNPNYSIFSDKDFVVDDQTGIAGPQNDEDLLRAISLYLGSNIGRYLMFFHSPEWGIDRNRILPAEVRDVPVPSFTQRQIARLAKLQKYAEETERRSLAIDQLGMFSEDKARNFAYQDQTSLQFEIEKNVEEILDLPASVRLVIRDFVDISLSLNKGKFFSKEGHGVRAVERPTRQELMSYAHALRNRLNNFTQNEVMSHLVSIIHSRKLTVCQVTAVATSEPLELMVSEAKREWIAKFQEIELILQREYSQWFYFQRELRIFDPDGKTVSICKPSRLIDWSQSRAFSDANDIILEYSLTPPDVKLAVKDSYASTYSDPQ